jgi:hypothetical protein
MSELIWGILSGTPLWVYLLFAYLMWLGSRSLKPSQVPVRKVAVLPAIFIIWGLSGLFGRPIEPSLLIGLWLLGFAIGSMLGLLSGPRLLAVEQPGGIIHFPASKAPLLRNLIIFGAHYTLNVLMALRPEQVPVLIQADISVSGASAGYFAGWAYLLWRRYRAAAGTEAATASAR